MARPWRLARALVALRDGVNARWPHRDKRSDGTIGNAEHATRVSDHNPHIVVAGMGVVRALDTDVDGIDAAWYAEQLRLLGAAGDARLTGGGYVIFNKRITRRDFSGWNVYTGRNPHTSHVHVSLSRNPAGFDDPRPWSFLGVATVAPPPPTAPPAPTGRPTLRQGSRGDAVRTLQVTLNRWYPRLPSLAQDGVFGPATRARVIYFQNRAGLTVDGIVGPKTWAGLGFR
jgi:Putative peptidoglycan binding domain